MLIHKDNREKIESTLLGNKRKFQDEQITVINSMYSTNIMACPGSGKTTVLIAKIALLLKKIDRECSSEGICVITHTNVAVEEIMKNLKKLGINDIRYPHFIGTIHEFFNNFFSLKAYGFFSKKEAFSILEKEEYEKYFQIFLKRHSSSDWIPDNLSFIENIEIKIDDNDELKMISRRDTPYDDKFINTVKDLFNAGFLRHSDTLALANWYIRKYQSKIQSAFLNRFSYLFIDEAQDTSIEQYTNLNMIIENKDLLVVQWFGDPYQALYSLYGKEEAWFPKIDQRLEINYSNRFGENIAKILRTTCIEEYTQLKVNESFHSAQPHIFIFDDQTKLQLLKVYSDTVNRFRREFFIDDVSGKIAAVCQHKFPLNSYLSSHESAFSKKASESTMQLGLRYCYRSVIQVIRIYDRNENNESKDYTKNTALFLNKSHSELHLSLKILWAKLILNISNQLETNEIVLEIKQKYKELVGKLLKINENEIDVSNVDMLNTQLFRLIQKEKDGTLNSNVDSNTSSYGVELNTVHGVKGETHFATLLLESTGPRGMSHSDLKPIFSFLTGDYKIEMIEDSNIKDTLKLAYVALSRPRYFVGIAMHKDNLTDQEIAAARIHGWKVIKLSSECLF